MVSLEKLESKLTKLKKQSLNGTLTDEKLNKFKNRVSKYLEIHTKSFVDDNNVEVATEIDEYNDNIDYDFWTNNDGDTLPADDYGDVETVPADDSDLEDSDIDTDIEMDDFIVSEGKKSATTKNDFEIEVNSIVNDKKVLDFYKNEDIDTDDELDMMRKIQLKP